MAELDFLLPFARAGTEGSILNCVRLAFVDAINLCLQNFHIHLTKVNIFIEYPVYSNTCTNLREIHWG